MKAGLREPQAGFSAQRGQISTAIFAGCVYDDIIPDV